VVEVEDEEMLRQTSDVVGICEEENELVGGDIFCVI